MVAVTEQLEWHRKCHKKALTNEVVVSILPKSVSHLDYSRY